MTISGSLSIYLAYAAGPNFYLMAVSNSSRALISLGFTISYGVNALYVDLWTFFPFFLRILEVIAVPTPILGPQYLQMNNLYPGKVTDVSLK